MYDCIVEIDQTRMPGEKEEEQQQQQEATATATATTAAAAATAQQVNAQCAHQVKHTITWMTDNV